MEFHPITQIDRQAFFDKAVIGLRKQGRRSMATYGAGSTQVCAYRGTGGCRCAVGWSIPDNKYHTSLEGKAVHRVEVLAALNLTEEGMSAADLAFLSDMQCELHDNIAATAFKSELETAIKHFAKHFNLTIPEREETLL